MDGTVTKEEAAARWRLDLEVAEADSRRAWPEDITVGPQGMAATLGAEGPERFHGSV